MHYAIIIRGPPASGKSVVGQKLAFYLKAYYMDFDARLKAFAEHPPTDGTLHSTTYADQALEILRKKLAKGTIVVIDGRFARKELLNYISANVQSGHVIFTLQASFRECLKRDSARPSPLAARELAEIYKAVTKVKMGEPIQTEGKTVEDVVRSIRHALKTLFPADTVQRTKFTK